jgi:uncharacterized protein YerC
MPKVKFYSVEKNKRYKIIGELFEIVASLKTKQEAVDFLIGLFTASETLMVARRIQIAKMLASGDSFDIIRKKLGVSYQTINTIEHWLEKEEKRDFLLKKLKQLEKAEQIGGREYSTSLLDKYAHHRFMKNLFK